MKNPIMDHYTSGYDGFEKRGIAVKKFSWAIPNDEAISSIVACGPVVEIGAGSGYWASLVAESGGDIVATDKYKLVDNEFTDKVHCYSKIEKLSALSAVRKYHNRALLSVWPSYQQSWSGKALAEYLKLGGQTVIYVGEGEYGCTGNKRFHNLLNNLRVVKEVSIPQWIGIHDHMEIRSIG
jgi:hypothetical protein